MSDLYKADASNFTREQLVELINIQTNLQLEANKTIVIAKGKIEELEHKLALAKEALIDLDKKLDGMFQELRKIRLGLILIHNNDDPKITVQNLRAQSLVLAGLITYELEAVNNYNILPSIKRARQILEQLK